MIDSCEVGDAAAICAIYNHYIATTVITFEVDPVAVEEMSRRIESATATHPWLVWREDGRVLGYAYATRWRERAAYGHSAETTIYLADAARGRGIGRALYAELLSRLEAAGQHVAIGGIALPNDASVALHERLGFERVAVFPEVGHKFGRWIDVGYWEKRLG